MVGVIIWVNIGCVEPYIGPIDIIQDMFIYGTTKLIVGTHNGIKVIFGIVIGRHIMKKGIGKFSRHFFNLSFY